MELTIGGHIGRVIGCTAEGNPGWQRFPGQAVGMRLARKADMFPAMHGRQAMHGNGAPQALDMGHVLTSGALWWVTTAVVAILIAVLVLRRHLRSHHLRSKVRYDLLPTISFDPSLQSVLAFAHQLGRARPVRGWVPRSVVGVRIRFATDPDFGKMTMSVEGRESITSVINKLVYPQVEIRRNTDVDGQGETTVAGRAEAAAAPEGEPTSRRAAEK
jgi:hypothetical protein